jgi:hypothetical protein
MLAARVSRRVIARALIDTRKHDNAKTKHECLMGPVVMIVALSTFSRDIPNVASS